MPMELLQANGGLVEGVSARTLRPNFTPDAKNVDLDVDGELHFPRLGTVGYSYPAAGANRKMTGLFPLTRKDGTKALIAACEGKLYRIKAKHLATPATDPTSSTSLPIAN